MMDEPDQKKHRAIEFARRLIARRIDLGLSQRELAARASAYLPANRTLSRASISRYESGENLPWPATLEALAKAMEIPSSELVPRSRAMATPRSPLSLDTDAAGNVRISIDQIVPMEVALQIMALLPKKP